METLELEKERLNCVLIVDDDEINNFINKRLLQKLEIASEVRVMTNGQQGINCLMHHCFAMEECPELILLDINMPVMDGFEFIEAFHTLNFENKDKVNIAVLTTSSNPIDKEKMGKLGIKYYLNKPLTEEKIHDFLHFQQKE
jgi:CheY-like chemotaxis protein